MFGGSERPATIITVNYYIGTHAEVIAIQTELQKPCISQKRNRGQFFGLFVPNSIFFRFSNSP